MNKNILKSALVLTLIGIFCGVLIGFANYITEPKINANRVKAARKAYEGFFPELTNLEIDDKVDGKYVYEYVKVIGENGVIGHAFRAKTTNQRGLVDIVIAADENGALMGVKILETGNTPGYYDKYESGDGSLVGVNGSAITGISGIDNIAGSTQTGDALDAMLKEVAKLAGSYLVAVEPADELSNYEKLFVEGSKGVIDEAFTASDIATEKANVYDSEDNLIGYTYTGTYVLDILAGGYPITKDAELTIIVGVDLEGKVVGLLELVNDHTSSYYSNYEEALNNLKGVDAENLNIDNISDSTYSHEALSQIFNAIKEVILNE